MSSVVEGLAREISKSPEYLNAKKLMFKKYASSLVGEEVEFLREDFKVFCFALQVLAKSESILYREEARRFLAMAIDVCLNDFPELLVIANNIFLEHGDFPNIPLLREKKDASLNFGALTNARNYIREDINRIDGIDYTFTDFQRELWEDLSSSNDVVVVAPTSAGKTHIILTYLVRKLIQEDAGFYVVIVPTRALISEVSSNIYDLLNKYGGEEVDICTVPNKDDFSDKTIFVMTQERLYELVLRGDLNFDFLFVDEAHNISDKNRGVLLHMTIERMMEDSSPQVVISMPSKLYKNAFSSVFPSVDFVSIVNDHSTVSKIIMNVIPRGRKLHISPIGEDYGVEISKGFKAKDLADIVLRLGVGESNLVFSNKTNNCEDLATRIAERIVLVDEISDELEDAASYVSELIHPEFTLVNNLRKSVAFHYGPLPTSVRVMVESLAKKNHIKYIVCTSTLAEGINLPAKNLFLKNPLIPVKGEPSKRMGDVQINNIVGRAGRMTKHFSGNVFLVEPQEWEFDDYFEEKDEVDKIPGYQESINNNWSEVANLLMSGYSESKELYLIANKLLKDFNREKLEEIFGSPLITLKESEKDTLFSAVKHAYDSMVVPVFTLEANPTIGYLQQNNLYKFLNTIDDLDDFIVPHPLAKDLYQKLIRIFNTLQDIGIYNPTQDYSISQVCLIAKKWIGSNPLSEIIIDQINWDLSRAKEYGKASPKINSSVRRVIKTINDDVRFRMSNSLKCYIEILDLILAIRNKDFLNVRLSYFFEIGSSVDEVISLINIGLSRESSLGIFNILGGSKEVKSKQQLSSYLRSGDLDGMHKVALQEIKNLLD